MTANNIIDYKQWESMRVRGEAIEAIAQLRVARKAMALVQRTAAHMGNHQGSSLVSELRRRVEEVEVQISSNFNPPQYSSELTRERMDA
jgi:hypothetical protein